VPAADVAGATAAVRRGAWRKACTARRTCNTLQFSDYMLLFQPTRCELAGADANGSPRARFAHGHGNERDNGSN
jgi:hypothetical protein